MPPWLGWLELEELVIITSSLAMTPAAPMDCWRATAAGARARVLSSAYCVGRARRRSHLIDPQTLHTHTSRIDFYKHACPPYRLG